MKTDETKKYRIIILILIVVNICLITTWWVLSIRSEQPIEEKQQNPRKDFFAQALKLDSIQKIQFDTLNCQHFQKLGQLNGRVDSLKHEMRLEIMRPATNHNRLDSLFKEIAWNRTVIDSTIYHHFQRLRNICQPNQVESFDSLINTFLMRKDKKDKGR